MRRDAFWSGLEAAVSAVLSIVTSFVVARLVGPAELGIGAAVTAVNVVLWVAVNALFADAIVQRASVNERALCSAFWGSTLAGGGATLIQAASGLGLAAVFGDSRLVPMALVLAAPLPLVGAAGAIQGVLTRERAYRSLALRTLIGQGFGTAIGVYASLTGAGGWAVVLQQATTSAVGAAALLLARRWVPRHGLDWASARSLLAVGGPLTAATLVLVARYRVFAVLIGGCAGPGVLGQVHIAFRLVETVRELTFTALWRLMLPSLSAHQHDREAMLREVDRWVRLCAIVVLPLCGVLATGLPHVVNIVMGPRWEQASFAAEPLVALMAFSALTFPSGVALVAVGQARFALYANLATTLVAAAGVLLFRPDDAWQAAIVWSISQVLVSPYTMWVSARALRVAVWRPLTGGFGRHRRPW